MNLTDHIINVALLGTATRELITTDFPEELQETLRDIQAKAEDACISIKISIFCCMLTGELPTKEN